jgi:hypothetical protein
MMAMSIRRWLLVCAVAAGVCAGSRTAWAFGGTAPDLPRRGNFVISNRANVGFTAGLSYAGATIDVAPELDYFVVQGLSVGGAAVFHWDSGGGTSGGIVPQIGYDATLSDSWSIWPRVAVSLIAGKPASASVEISAPFLVHPAQHFFFGFGPAISIGFAGDHRVTFISGTFLVGGYFDS